MPTQHAAAMLERLTRLTPAPLATTAGLAPKSTVGLDLDTTEELALRAVLLGILHRRVGHLEEAAGYLAAVVSLGFAHLDEGHTYLVAVAMFEAAVLECQRADRETTEVADASEATQIWMRRLRAAEKHIEEVFKLPAFLMQSRCPQPLLRSTRSWCLRTVLQNRIEMPDAANRD
jgi:hypothetical protein